MIEVLPPTDGLGGGAICHLPRDSRLRAGEHPRPAIFLDRDGVLVEDVHFLRRPEDLRVLDGVPEALRRLASRYALVVITNQSGVARGYLDEPMLLAIHGRLLEALHSEGVTVDAIYACPHHPEGAVPRLATRCDCRKPAPGMIQRAAREHELTLPKSIMIGDAPRDVEAGRSAGTKAILLEPADATGDVPHSLFEALRWIP